MENWNNMEINTGKIVQVLGPVVDVEFDEGKLPLIKDALTVEVDGKRLLWRLPSLWVTVSLDVLHLLPAKV